jgi:hypothetical protein
MSSRGGMFEEDPVRYAKGPAETDEILDNWPE